MTGRNRDRLERLERPDRAAARAAAAVRIQIERDAAEFRQRIDAIAARMESEGVEPGAEARSAWAVWGKMLAGYPGCALAFSNLGPEDLRL